jgi:hypothetical protein
MERYSVLEEVLLRAVAVLVAGLEATKALWPTSEIRRFKTNDDVRQNLSQMATPVTSSITRFSIFTNGHEAKDTFNLLRAGAKALQEAERRAAASKANREIMVGSQSFLLRKSDDIGAVQ